MIVFFPQNGILREFTSLTNITKNIILIMDGFWQLVSCNPVQINWSRDGHGQGTNSLSWEMLKGESISMALQIMECCIEIMVELL